MIDTIYANVAAARLELSEVRDPPVQVRDALKRLVDVLDLINNDRTNAARDAWIEKEASRSYTASIAANTHNLHCRAWSELNDTEKLPWRLAAETEWNLD